jgi:hypothetical protein
MWLKLIKNQLPRYMQNYAFLSQFLAICETSTIDMAEPKRLIKQLNF